MTDESRYYDADESACLPCEGEALVPVFAGIGAAVATIALVWSCRAAQRRWAPSSVLRLQRLSLQLSLRAKLKQMLSFYQVATRVSDVYVVPMPEAVARLLSVFEVLNINISGIGLPLQCLGLGTYEQQLAATMLLPVLIAAAIVFGFVVCSCTRAKGAGTGLLAALPYLLPLSFLVFPMVSSAAFRAFSCEAFDNGREFLRADYRVECSTGTRTSAAASARSGAHCAWSNDFVLTLYTGKDPIAMPRTALSVADRIELRPGVVRAKLGASRAAFGAAEIEPPLNPLAVDAHLVGPTTIGACDPALFTASSSTGAGGRPMRYEFRVTSEYDAGKILERIRSLPANMSSSELELRADDLEPGGVYSIVVEVTNFLGAASTATVTARSSC